MSRPIRPVCLERVFQCPSKYIQGPTAIQNAAKYLSPFGKNVLVLSDAIVYKIGVFSFYHDCARRCSYFCLVLYSWRFRRRIPEGGKVECYSR